MKKYSVLLLILSILSIFLGGCFRTSPVLYISGDRKAINADIFIDNKKAGIMKKIVYTGSKSKNPVVIQREKKVQKRLGIEPGDLFSGAEIMVPKGRHELMFIGKDGKRLKKRIKVQSENYINVDFEKNRISGGG